MPAALLPDAKQVELALRSTRTIEQAINAPTIALSAKVMGEEAMITMLTATVWSAMQNLFDESQRLTEDQCAAWAESLYDEYKHESLGDLPVFLKRAALGKYRKGKSYGRLTMMTINVWWQEYLGEKAEEWERLRMKENKRASIAVDDAVLQKMREGSAGGPTYGDWRIIARLKEQVETMTEDQLRSAYKRHRTQQAKDIIMEEVKRRGIPLKNQNSQ